MTRIIKAISQKKAAPTLMGLTGDTLVLSLEKGQQVVFGRAKSLAGKRCLQIGLDLARFNRTDDCRAKV
jgi:hypothetical protein